MKMSDFKSLSVKEISDALLKIEHPLVLMHVRPDADTVGTAGALLEIFRLLGKDPLYDLDGDIPERLAFLLAGETRAEGYEGLTPVAVDVASPTQLGALYGKLSVALTVDHHAVGEPFSDNLTLPGVSSAGEVMLSIAEELEGRGLIQITPKIAERLYAAISSDTGGFMFSNAKESTYLAAARLIARGIDTADINRRLFFSKTKAAIIAEGAVGADLRTACDGRIAYALIDAQKIKKLGLSFADFETAIDVVRSLGTAEIAFVIKENDKGEFKVSLRSVGPDVAAVAAKHSGGGHKRAAGCTVTSGSIEKAAELLVDELTELL